MIKSKIDYPRMHVSLYVSNLLETINFYTAFFGKPAEKVESGYAKYVLDKPSLIISFIENQDRVQQNFGHLGFQLETKELLEAQLDRIKNVGLHFKEEMGTSCCYALQDKFWVADPDGIQWEMYYFHEDVAFNDPHHAIETSEKPKMNIADLSNSNSCEPGSGCC